MLFIFYVCKNAFSFSTLFALCCTVLCFIRARLTFSAMLLCPCCNLVQTHNFSSWQRYLFIWTQNVGHTFPPHYWKHLYTSFIFHSRSWLVNVVMTTASYFISFICSLSPDFLCVCSVGVIIFIVYQGSGSPIYKGPWWATFQIWCV